MKKLWIFLPCIMLTCLVHAASLQLQLPPKIYAVPGIEMNVYFDNVVLTPNSDNFVFDVDCPKGRNDQKRWRFTPQATDLGTYEWNLKVMDADGIVAQGKTTLIVSPADAGKGKTISILILGDSLTHAGVYPRQLLKLTQQPGNPTLAMIGTNGPRRKDPKALCAHEGWGGWTWQTFLVKTKPYDPQNPKPWDVASPFVIKDKNGKAVFHVQQYLDKYNQGKAPDVITIQLGVNDVFGAKDANLDDTIKNVLANADTMLDAFQKVAPNAIIGIGLCTPSARTQDAFGSNYGCGQTRWQYRKNQHRLNQAYLKKFLSYKNPKVSIIPTNLNLDCEHNFPTVHEPVNLGNKSKLYRQSNGVHPATAGYNQMADTYFSWLKYQLSK